jgi:hypothetical protein
MAKLTILSILLLLLLTLTSCSQVIDLYQGLESIRGVEASPTLFIPQLSPLTETVTITPTTTATVPNISSTPILTKTPSKTRTKHPNPTPTITIPPIIRHGPNNFPDYVNPLTGLIPINPLLLDRRPIAVKIPNYPHYVYPQSGLSQADQIFEYHLEQGLTRFIAIFYGNDTQRVGPIRSGRRFDAHIIQMYNSAFVFNYAYREEGNEPLDVLGYLESILDDRLFVNDPGVSRSWMWRDETIHSYNNLFGNTYNISRLITQRGVENVRQDLETNLFTTLGSRGNEKVSVINVNYSYANYAYWEYNKSDNKYYRYQGNVDLDGVVEPEYILLTDANNDLPITANNIVILYVPHKFTYKSGRSEVFDIRLVDQGDAWVFRNGSAFKALWERREVNKPLYLLTLQGSPFPLYPGVTFFQVIHTDSEFYIQGEEEWTFKFIRPLEPLEKAP